MSRLSDGWNRVTESVRASALVRFLSSYPEKNVLFPAHENKNPKSLFRRFRLSFARGAEQSALGRTADRCADGLMGLPVRSLGIFFVAFGVYGTVFRLLRYYLDRGDQTAAFFWSLGTALAAIPLLFSVKPLYETLRNSVFGRILTRWFGIRFEEEKKERSASHAGVCMLSGVALAIASLWVPVPYLLLGLFVLPVLVLIFRQPEVALPMLCLLLPFLPTLVLVCLAAVTFLALLFKVIRGNRILHLERSDLFVAIFALFLLLGGVMSVTADAVFPALVYTCFLMSYFLVTSLMTSREWLERCIFLLLLGALGVSVWGILQYFFGPYVGSAAWLDRSLFGDIARRAVSTLENPNMLGEYLLMLLPLAMCDALRASSASRRFFGWSTLLTMLVCLGLTFSRGAWIGAGAALIVFLCVETRHLYPVLILGGVSVPLVLWVLPGEFLNRLVNIVNLSDSSIQYRMNIWRGTLKMIRDWFWGGIGVGSASWEKVYPSYSLEAIEAAPHSHSLYLQILTEIGIFGLIAFLAVLVIHWQSSYSCRIRLGNHPVWDDERAGEQRKKLSWTRSYVTAVSCGIFGACLFGVFDYAWYNYRVFLMFWIMMGLVSAIARTSVDERRRMSETERRFLSPHEGEMEIRLDASPERDRPAE